MKQYCLACDLKDEESHIKAYDDYHKNVWPEIKESLQRAGILEMEIYRTGNRLFMIIQVSPDFSLRKKLQWTLKIQPFRNGRTLCQHFKNIFHGLRHM